MKIYIRSNNFTDIQQKQAMECIDVLSSKGHECSVSGHTSKLLYGDDSHYLFSPAACDLIISLGGDGALLSAAKTAIEADKPLLGINSGRRGYLCAMSYSDLPRFNELYEKCGISERSLLCFEHEGREYDAVNDIVVSKSDFGKTVDLHVSIEGQEEFEVRGDGVILCTPTGSTAYNLSASGPRLDVKADVFAVTPICAHDKNIYSRVISDERKIRVFVNHENAMIYCDGEFICDTDSEAVFERSKRKLKLCLRKGS